jgi:hypothetical protein
MVSGDPAERDLALPSLSPCIAWFLGFFSPKFYSFISFAPPKETNQRKGGRKGQLRLFWAPATQGLEGTTKKAEVGFAELAKF